MQSTRALKNLDVSRISTFLAECKQPFQTSHLDDAVENKKLVDTERRLSEFRSITDERLFDLAEDIVKQLSAQDESADFTLVRNDLTHIRYHTGGFFKKHEDYLSVTSNLVEEYTLLLCVTPAGMHTVGGETVIFGHIGSQAYKETTTRGDALVFRKDVMHEGRIIEAGEKHILSFNLWAMRKHSGQVLLVTFPPAEEAASKLQGVEALHEAANDKSSYVLAVADAKGSEMLAAHIEWVSGQAEGGDIIRHSCKLFTFEQFGTLFRVLTQSHISATELAANKPVIDFYCPSFVYEHLLVDKASQPVASSPEVKSPEVVGGIKAACDFSAPSDDIIVCESEERMRVVADLARTLQLPYVPFKMIFVEGVLQTFGECGDDAFTLPLLPVWLSLGDHDSIFMFRNIAGLSPPKLMTLGELHARFGFLEHARPEQLAKLHPGERVKGLSAVASEEDYYGNDVRALSLMFALDMTTGHCMDEPHARRGIFDRWASRMRCAVFESTAHYGTPPLVYLPGAADVEVGTSNGLFHRDGAGRTCFSAAEAKAASDFIASLNLEDKVKARLQEKRFVLPQVHEDVLAGFCNENVYGKLNLLSVTGVVRLDRDAPKGSLPAAGEEEATFDVWPPPSVLDDAIHTNFRNHILPYAEYSMEHGIVVLPSHQSTDDEDEDDEDDEDDALRDSDDAENAEDAGQGGSAP